MEIELDTKHWAVAEVNLPSVIVVNILYTRNFVRDCLKQIDKPGLCYSMSINHHFRMIEESAPNFQDDYLFLTINFPFAAGAPKV